MYIILIKGRNVQSLEKIHVTCMVSKAFRQGERGIEREEERERETSPRERERSHLHLSSHTGLMKMMSHHS